MALISSIETHLLNIICIVGLVCNTASLIIFLQPLLRRKPFTIYHVTLTIWDTALIGFSYAPLVLYKLAPQTVSPYGVIVNFVAMNCTMNACILLTVAATHERFIAITRPMKRFGKSGLRRALWTIIVISVISIVYNVPKCWELTTKLESFHQNETNQTTPSPKVVPAPFRSLWPYKVLYRLLGGILMGSIIPMGFVMYMGTKVVKSVKASSAFHTSMATKKPSEATPQSGETLRTNNNNLTLEITPDASPTHRLKPMGNKRSSAGSHYSSRQSLRVDVPPRGQQNSVANMVIVHTLKFTIAYSIPTLCDLVEVYFYYFGTKSQMRKPPSWYSVAVRLGNFLVILNSSTNFFMYYFFCAEFRSNAARLVGRMRAHFKPTTTTLSINGIQQTNV